MYYWRITVDYIDDREESYGVEGGDIPAGLVPREEDCRLFRMRDGDGELYYEGLFYGDEDATEFEPLDDYGTPNAGATTIEYFDPVGCDWRAL